MTTQQDYYERVREFAKEYDETPSIHIIDIMASVMMSRDGYLQGGSFVQSIINNDLFGAINRGDKECIQHLKLIVATKHYCHLKN